MFQTHVSVTDSRHLPDTRLETKTPDTDSGHISRHQRQTPDQIQTPDIVEDKHINITVQTDKDSQDMIWIQASFFGHILWTRDFTQQTDKIDIVAY